MNTITAKELRDNLDQIVKRVRRGESIKVTYRSKAAFTLQPEQPSPSLLPGSVPAMKKFSVEVRKLRNSKKQPTFNPNKSTKELYNELLDNDPKYKPPYHR